MPVIRQIKSSRVGWDVIGQIEAMSDWNSGSGADRAPGVGTVKNRWLDEGFGARGSPEQPWLPTWVRQ